METWKRCECGVEMAPGSECKAVEIGSKRIGMKTRIPYDGRLGENCPDCGVRTGGLHHLGCDQVRCPFCHGQESFCDCDIDQVSVWEEVPDED